MKTNRVTLIGYVAQELATFMSQNGSKRTLLRIATHYYSKREKSYHTVWHDIIAWDATAEYAACNFVKGSKIMVEGSIEYRTFPDHTGHLRYHTQIRADSLMNLDR